MSLSDHAFFFDRRPLGVELDERYFIRASQRIPIQVRKGFFMRPQAADIYDGVNIGALASDADRAWLAAAGIVLD